MNKYGQKTIWLDKDIIEEVEKIAKEKHPKLYGKSGKGNFSLTIRDLVWEALAQRGIILPKRK
jgi:hypothetical protein